MRPALDVGDQLAAERTLLASIRVFQEFKDARTTEIPQLLSDPPNDQNRIDALERHFKSDSAVFVRFDPNLRSATPFQAPKRAP